MSKAINKDDVAKKMFYEGETDNLMINTDRSKDRVKLREEGERFAVRKFKVQFIALADIIRRSETQVRASDFDPDRYEEDRQLLESIRNKGVVTPIMVKEIISDDDDPFAPVKYELLYGHRRTSACKVLGYTTIPAQIVDSRIDTDEITMLENMGVRPLTPFERGREIDKYMQKTGINGGEFAAQNGFSASRVSELLSAFRSVKDIPELAELYQDGKITSRYLPAIAKIYSVSDQKTKELLIEKLPEFSERKIKEMLDFCEIGGKPAGYIKAHDSDTNLTVGQTDVTDTANKEENTSGTETKKEKTNDPEILQLWERIEKSRTFAKKTANLYGCEAKDVKEAASVCRESGLKPDAIKIFLAAKKNGALLNKDFAATAKKALADPETEKNVLSYFNVYEKTLERKNKLLKNLKTEDPEKMSFYDAVFGDRR